MRSQIFLGSSSEGLKYLNLISTYLEPVGEITKWITAFAQNRSALDSLIKKTKLADFAILVATCDDATLKREEVKITPRDNIIFEFGLFMGATGLDRAFLLAEEGANLPSDLDGITVARFSPDVTKHNSLEKECAKIAAHIREQQDAAILGFLPSTALALGYYHSFVKCLCEQIRDTQLISTGDQEVSVKDFHLNVIVPAELDSNGVVDFAQHYNQNSGLEQARTIGKTLGQRGYPFHFKIDPEGQDLNGPIEVKLFDVPTTLNTIVETVKLFIPSDKVGSSDQEYLEARELQNFVKVLKHLVRKNTLTKKHVSIIDEVAI